MVVHARYPVGEPRVQREAWAAREAGYDVTVIALRDRGEPAREIIDGIEVRRLPVRHDRGASLPAFVLEYTGFAVLAAATVTWLALRKRFAVVHVHAPPDALIGAGLGARLLGARLLLDIHDLSPHIFSARMGPGRASRWLRRALTMVERAACRFADRVITVHGPYRDQLLAAGVSEEKVVVVMNSADERVIETVRTAASAERTAEFTVAYHGTITHWYGVHLLVEAVALLRDQIPNLRALILGEGDALKGLRERALELGVADRVHFSGRYLPLEEVLLQVRTANCGVIPNLPTELNRFALSSKLFEYVSLEIPAIVSRLETLGAHFSDDEVAFFEPGSAESLAARIAADAADPEAARDRAGRARRRSEEYAWRRNAERYVSILNSLGASGGADRGQEPRGPGGPVLP